jgi:hypothetical protein
MPRKRGRRPARTERPLLAGGSRARGARPRSPGCCVLRSPSALRTGSVRRSHCRTCALAGALQRVAAETCTSSRITGCPKGLSWRPAVSNVQMSGNCHSEIARTANAHRIALDAATAPTLERPHPSGLDLYAPTASLRHVRGFPALGLLRRLRPSCETMPDSMACQRLPKCARPFMPRFARERSTLSVRRGG